MCSLKIREYFEKHFFEKGVTPNLFSLFLVVVDFICIICIFGILAILVINLNNSNGQSLFGYILAIVLCIIPLGYSVVIAIFSDSQMNVFSNNLEKMNKKNQEFEKENRESFNAIQKKLQELEQENRELHDVIHKKLEIIENLCKKNG